MAKIGLDNFRYGILTEAQDGTPSYDGAHKPAKAISCNVEIENNDAKLYADNVLAESDTSFQSGTVTIGIDDEDQATQANLLGHTVNANGEMVRNADDTAPYIGFGRVITKMVGGVYKYKVEFLYKVKFSEPSQEDNTKGENLEFGTSEMEGTVATLLNGKWSVTKTFDTKADAVTFLEGLLGGGAGVTVTLEPNDITNYTVEYTDTEGETQTVTMTVGATDAVTITAVAGSAVVAIADGINVDTTAGGTPVYQYTDADGTHSVFLAYEGLVIAYENE